MLRTKKLCKAYILKGTSGIAALRLETHFPRHLFCNRHLISYLVMFDNSATTVISETKNMK